jgi:hypothetical protein
MMRSKEQWRDLLELKLPPRGEYILRNRAITALYAHWYLHRPALFKWAGMAAFASEQVGIATAAVEMLKAPNTLVESPRPLNGDNLLAFGAGLYNAVFSLAWSIPVALHDITTRQLVGNDLEQLKRGNDAIFNDAGWAHQAYLEQGLEAIEKNVADHEREYLLEGFRRIDAGAKKLNNPNQVEEGEALVREGNRLLLRHEQEQTLAPIMRDLTELGRIIFSLASALDFRGDGLVAGVDAPWFGGYYGLLAVVSRQRCVSRFEDRWQWIEYDVLKRWAAFEQSEATLPILKRRLQAMADQEPTALQQVTAFLKLLYPTIGLSSNAAPLLNPAARQ